MSGVVLTLTFDQTGAAAGFLALRQANENLRPILEGVGSLLQSTTVERFHTNVDPAGQAWPRSRAAAQRGSPTLVEDGYLRDSVAHRLDGDSAVEVFAGSNAGPYASIHQTGFDGTVQIRTHERSFTMVFGKPRTGTAKVKAHSRRLRMPKRAYLGISADDDDAIGEIVTDAWRTALARGAA